MKLSEQHRLFNPTSVADQKGSHDLFYFNNVGKVLWLTTADILSKLFISNFDNIYPSLKH
jgi:hypothetical protein